MITDIHIEHADLPDPRIDWKQQPKHWLSLTTAKLNGGFLFGVDSLPVDALFAEEGPAEEVCVVGMTDGRIGVISGAVTITRAILSGKSGIDARFYRL
jgi:hypothetical protein